MLFRSDDWVKLLAAHSLGKIGPPAHEAVPSLAAVANVGNTRFRIAVVQAIGKIGGEPDLSVKTLMDIINDEALDIDLLEFSIQSLGSFPTKRDVIIPRITRFRDHKNETVRRASSYAIATLQR